MGGWWGFKGGGNDKLFGATAQNACSCAFRGTVAWRGAPVQGFRFLVRVAKIDPKLAMQQDRETIDAGPLSMLPSACESRVSEAVQKAHEQVNSIRFEHCARTTMSIVRHSLGRSIDFEHAAFDNQPASATHPHAELRRIQPRRRGT